MPEDLDGDGLCDVLQILLVGDFEPPEPGFCTDGEITGGNGLVGQDVYTELVVIEKTGGTYQYQYEIHDWTNELHEDLQQDASNHDFRGYYEYYDVFLSDADGTFNPNGSFVTVQARSDLSTTNLGVGHNIDAIGIRDANGNVLYASEIVSVGLETVWAATTQTAVNRPSSAPPMKSPPRWATAKHRSPLASAPPWWKRPMSLHQASAPWLRWRPSVRRCSPAAAVCWTSKTPSESVFSTLLGWRRLNLAC